MIIFEWINANIFYIFETLGICTFALSGLILAKRKGFDPVGLYIIAFITALGGGTVRDLILDSHPIYWVSHSEYPVLILVLTLLMYYTSKIKLKEEWLIIPDAIGLSLFAITGAQVAFSNNLEPMIVMILATVTACFGGIIRDILCQEVPMVFKKTVTFYSFPTFIGAGLYLGLLELGIENTQSSLLGFTFILGFRLLSVKYNWKFR